MKPTAELPDDPTLRGLAAIRADGLAVAIPSLQGIVGPVHTRLRGYTAGERATLEVVAASHHVAVTSYAEDPAQEAALYEALGVADAAHDPGVRVPPLVAWHRDLRVLVLGWLEGPSTSQLIKERQGARAGQLAARWFRHVAALRIRIGPWRSAAHALGKASEGIAHFGAAHLGLGAAAMALAGNLARTQPEDGVPHLVHGTLYERHILDLGDGPGVIDWQRFGRGSLELDAGTFLATLSRIALRQPQLAGEVATTEEAFRGGTGDLFDDRILTWYRAAALLRFAAKPVSQAGDARLRASGVLDPRPLALFRARGLLDEAARVAAPLFRDIVGRDAGTKPTIAPGPIPSLASDPAVEDPRVAP